jgi:aspartyl-tRNA(Asn)/glutamyl-tRNA(Gln) amidotransferase subunit A
MTSPLWSLTAIELLAGYRRRLFSPLTVLEAVRQRFEAVNPVVNAIVAVDWVAAEAAAAGSSARWLADAPLSGLDGVPLSIKDNLYAAGLAASWGSLAYKDFVPPTDELPVARLRAAGAVIIGKTNVPEFTLQGFTSNALFGTTRNPHALDRTPGGSSGGGAAAVAAGLGPLALGTDGGGSLRRPAAHCGLFALKPSIGQIGRSGGFPQILSDFEVVGPIGRSIDDLEVMFSVLRGATPSDPRSLAASAPATDFGTPVRVGYFRHIEELPVDPLIVDHLEALAAALAAEGCAVSPINAPFDLGRTNAIWGTVAGAGLAWHVASLPETSVLGANASAMRASGAAISTGDYISALAGANALRSEAAVIFEQFDILLCPATAALAWPAELAFPPSIAGLPAGPRGHAIFTAWMNVAGLAAVTVPVAMTSDAGGIGMQLVAAAGRDRDLLQFCKASPAIRALGPAGLSQRI